MLNELNSTSNYSNSILIPSLTKINVFNWNNIKIYLTTRNFDLIFLGYEEERMIWRGKGKIVVMLGMVALFVSRCVSSFDTRTVEQIISSSSTRQWSDGTPTLVSAKSLTDKCGSLPKNDATSPSNTNVSFSAPNHNVSIYVCKIIHFNIIKYYFQKFHLISFIL